MVTVMKEAIRKAAVLIEAMPYIRLFQGKVFIIKFGGAAMEDDSILDSVLEDVIFLEAVGIRTVLVHGGGLAISSEMKKRDIEPKFIHGHRVTDKAAMEIVRDVLVNKINAAICHRIERMGGHVLAFPGSAHGALYARRRIMREATADGSVEEYDLGLVGDMEGIDKKMFCNAIEARHMPVVAPLAHDANGEMLNVNADMVAAFIAGELGAEKVVFLSNTHGILTDPNDSSSFAGTLTTDEVDTLIRNGIIDGGMLPKVEACRQALKNGVRKAHIIDGRIRHALLLEIFTDKGVGTQIIH